MESLKDNYTDEQPLIMTRGLTLILAFACGSIVANLYYAQTVITWMGNSLQLDPYFYGFIVTLTQIGYGFGLIFIVPLADLTENRHLIVCLLYATSFFLLGLLMVNTITLFLLFCFLLGLTAVAAQIIVPFAAHLSSQENRGQVVGNVMSGLFLGIMLARPFSSFLADYFSWKAIFLFSAILMLLLAITLNYILPKRKTALQLSYQKVISSLPIIFKSNPILQRRALYQAMLFGIFNLFWTSIAMRLMDDSYSQTQIGLFAFAGATGAFTAPIAGRLADSGRTRLATGIAIVIIGVSFVLAKWNAGDSIATLVIAALILDCGVSCNLVLGQRTIYSLAPEIRGRLNGLYMTILFIGGAIGSSLAGYLYKLGGWNYITNLGLSISIIAFIYFITEYLTDTKDFRTISH